MQLCAPAHLMLTVSSGDRAAGLAAVRPCSLRLSPMALSTQRRCTRPHCRSPAECSSTLSSRPSLQRSSLCTRLCTSGSCRRSSRRSRAASSSSILASWGPSSRPLSQRQAQQLCRTASPTRVQNRGLSMQPACRSLRQSSSSSSSSSSRQRLLARTLLTTQPRLEQSSLPQPALLAPLQTGWRTQEHGGRCAGTSAPRQGSSAVAGGCSTCEQAQQQDHSSRCTAKQVST